MPQQESMPAPKKENDTSILLTEYQALRDELVKRIEFRYQLVNLILIIAGTFLTIGVQPNIPSAVLLVYPILALFLLAGWAHNGEKTLNIARYVREHIEPEVEGLGWETHMKNNYPLYQPFRTLGFLYVAGLVIATQIIAAGVALLKTNFVIIDKILIGCSTLAIVLTVILLRHITKLER